MADDVSGAVEDAQGGKPTADHHIHHDINDLHQFGYKQNLRRTMGAYTSFALGFSMITITTTIFTLLVSLSRLSVALRFGCGFQ